MNAEWGLAVTARRYGSTDGFRVSSVSCQVSTPRATGKTVETLEAQRARRPGGSGWKRMSEAGLRPTASSPVLDHRHIHLAGQQLLTDRAGQQCPLFGVMLELDSKNSQGLPGWACLAMEPRQQVSRGAAVAAAAAASLSHRLPGSVHRPALAGQRTGAARMEQMRGNGVAPCCQ